MEGSYFDCFYITNKPELEQRERAKKFHPKQKDPIARAMACSFLVVILMFYLFIGITDCWYKQELLRADSKTVEKTVFNNRMWKILTKFTHINIYGVSHNKLLYIDISEVELIHIDIYSISHYKLIQMAKNSIFDIELIQMKALLLSIRLTRVWFSLEMKTYTKILDVCGRITS